MKSTTRRLRPAEHQITGSGVIVVGGCGNDDVAEAVAVDVAGRGYRIAGPVPGQDETGLPVDLARVDRSVEGPIGFVEGIEGGPAQQDVSATIVKTLRRIGVQRRIRRAEGEIVEPVAVDVAQAADGFHAAGIADVEFEAVGPQVAEVDDAVAIAVGRRQARPAEYQGADIVVVRTDEYVVETVAVDIADNADRTAVVVASQDVTGGAVQVEDVDTAVVVGIESVEAWSTEHQETGAIILVGIDENGIVGGSDDEIVEAVAVDVTPSRYRVVFTDIVDDEPVGATEGVQIDQAGSRFPYPGTVHIDVDPKGGISGYEDLVDVLTALLGSLELPSVRCRHGATTADHRQRVGGIRIRDDIRGTEGEGRLRHAIAQVETLDIDDISDDLRPHRAFAGRDEQGLVTGEIDGVDTAAAVDDQVFAVVDEQAVVPVAAEEGIGAETAEEDIVSVATDENVVAALAEEQVVPVVPDDDVGEVGPGDVFDVDHGVGAKGIAGGDRNEIQVADVPAVHGAEECDRAGYRVDGMEIAALTALGGDQDAVGGSDHQSADVHAGAERLGGEGGAGERVEGLDHVLAAAISGLIEHRHNAVVVEGESTPRNAEAVGQAGRFTRCLVDLVEPTRTDTIEITGRRMDREITDLECVRVGDVLGETDLVQDLPGLRVHGGEDGVPRLLVVDSHKQRARMVDGHGRDAGVAFDRTEKRARSGGIVNVE